VPNSKKLIHASDASIISPDFESPISSLKQRHQQNGNNDALMIVLTNSTMNSSGGSNASSDDGLCQRQKLMEKNEKKAHGDLW
jgi:hypothetical protein